MKNSKSKEEFENALKVINDQISTALAYKAKKGDIAAIRLFDKHSHVQLPKGMPKQLFQHLQKVRVRSQLLAITPAE